MTVSRGRSMHSTTCVSSVLLPAAPPRDAAPGARASAERHRAGAASHLLLSCSRNRRMVRIAMCAACEGGVW